MCKLQERPFEMDIPKPEEKKTKKAKKTTGVEVVQAVQEASEPQMIVNENAQPAFELPSYEDMMLQDMFNGPSLMETQPNLAPVKVLEEGVAVTQDGRTVEWWSMEPPLDSPANLDQKTLQEYLMDASKPLHTNFVLPEQGLANCYTCPVYFGNAENKQTVLSTICNKIHAKIHQQWGTFACHRGLVPRLKLSQTPRNPNKVFLSCSKAREARCSYFQWIHEAPKPKYVPKTATPSALKKRLHEMVQERVQLEKRPKVEEGGFQFP